MCAAAGLAVALATGMISAAHAASSPRPPDLTSQKPDPDPYAPKPGTPCPRGDKASHNGLAYQCLKVKDKKSGKVSWVWSMPTAEDNSSGDLWYVKRIPVQDRWSLGPMVMDSLDMDFMPVDPEAVALPGGGVRLIVDRPDGAAQLHFYSSSDGVTFTADDIEPWKGTFASVVALPDGRYRMYYTLPSTVPGQEDIRSAISDDALNWTEEPGVRFADATESSAVILKDGRTLMAMRRDMTAPFDPDRSCNQQGSSIWFAVSSDGLEFSDAWEAVDGSIRGLGYRAYGVELARMADGKVRMYFEGCTPQFAVDVNEKSLKLGKMKRTSIRSLATARHYGLNTANSGGPQQAVGGDISIIVRNKQDWAYVSLMSADGDDRWGGVRQTIVVAKKR